MTTEAPLAYASGANSASFLPPTTTTKSVASSRERIAADRKVSFDGSCPSTCGGQGSSALSVPMREDSPAARMTPAKLGERAMLRKIAESGRKVSEPEFSSGVVAFVDCLFNYLRVGGRS